LRRELEDRTIRRAIEMKRGILIRTNRELQVAAAADATQLAEGEPHRHPDLGRRVLRPVAM
jgi:hypothetical protein